jgi:hypothetical protein
MITNIKQHTPEWIEAKLSTIGGSEIYGLIYYYCKQDIQKLGINLLEEPPFSSALELFIKIKFNKRVDNFNVVNSEFGLGMEDYISTRLAIELDKCKINSKKDYIINQNIHPLVSCSPDGYIDLTGEVKDYDGTCIINKGWGLGILEGKTAPFDFHFESKSGAKWKYIFQVQYNMMVTVLKWGVLALLVPKERDLDNDFTKGKVVTLAKYNEWDEIDELYDLYYYIYPAMPVIQSLIIKALNAFQADLDNNNWPLPSSHLPTQQREKKALSLVYPDRYGILQADEEINGLINMRQQAQIEENKIASEKNEAHLKILQKTGKYCEIIGLEYRGKYDKNGVLKFYKNKQ